MRVTFLGVGEACDTRHPNTSLLILSKGLKRTMFLLDCGFTTPHQFFKQVEDPDELDVLWISHFHGDHFFGVPLLLLRLKEMGRTKSLVVAGQNGIGEMIIKTLDLAYPGVGKKIPYPIEYIAVEPGQALDVCGAKWQSAENVHSMRALSVRIDMEGKSIYYSGDGRPAEESAKLAQGCDLVVHEAFRFEGETPGHGSIRGVVDFAGKSAAKRLAIVHVEHNDRQQHALQIRNMLASMAGIKAFMPQPGEIVDL